MKKILNITLALLILISSLNSVFTSVFAEETDTLTASYEDVWPKYQSEAEFLEEIGVLPQNFVYGGEITRGDFAYMIAKLLFYNVSYADISTGEMFSDIDSNHKYFNEIKVLKNLRIVSGFAGNVFYPDDLISFQDAITIIIKALSYEQYTESLGGYPTGYLYLAKLVGLYKGIDEFSGYLDFDTAAKIVYNALFIDTVNIDHISEDGISFTINVGKNVLSQYLNIKQYDAVLINDGISSFNGIELDSANKVIVRDFNTSEDYLFTVTNNEICEYFGQRLKIFTKENEKKEEEILSYEVSNKVSITELSGDKIVNYTDSYVEYELNDEASKFAKISLSRNYPPVVFINGVHTIDYNSKDFKNSDSRIVLIDNNDDGKIDVINIYRYDTNIVVSGILDNYVTDKSEGGNSLDLDNDTAIYRFVHSQKFKNLDDIRANDVISVAKSSKKITGKDVYYLTVSRGSASGILESKGDDELVIDGKTYKVAPAAKNKISSLKFENIKGYLDSFGRIIYFEKSSSEKNYAYVLGAGLSGNAIDSEGIVRLFTVEGKAETYTLDEKVNMNGSTLPNGFEIDDLILKLKDTTEDLIVYSLNSEGKIKDIIFAQPFDTDEKNNEDKFVFVKQSSSTAEAYSGYSFGGVSVDGTKCFNISSSFDVNGKGCEVFNLKPNQYYSNVKFYDLKFDGTVGAALIKGAASSSSFSKNPSDVYIFDCITDCLNNEGDIGKKIYYYNKGIRGSVIVSSDVRKVTMSDAYIPQKEYDYEKIEDLKFGDIFTFETDTDGYLSGFCKLYEHDPLALPDEDGKIFLSASGGTGTAKDIFMAQGTLRYRAADKIVLRLNGSDLSLMPFTRAGGEQAYIVNTANKKIKLVPVDQLNAQDFYNNIPGDSILVQASRHQLKEVIIYE